LCDIESGLTSRSSGQRLRRFRVCEFYRTASGYVALDQRTRNNKACPNRFAGQVDKSQVVVMPDPDISEVFTTPESVNAILRAPIKTMPTAQAKPGRRSPSESTRNPTLR
jgi:hypothetical protein